MRRCVNAHCSFLASSLHSPLRGSLAVLLAFQLCALLLSLSGLVTSAAISDGVGSAGLHAATRRCTAAVRFCVATTGIIGASAGCLIHFPPCPSFLPPPFPAMSGLWDGWASTLSYYTGYDFLGHPTPPTQPHGHLQQQSSSSSSRPSGTADYSGQAADPSSLDDDDDDDDNVTALYSTAASDDDYFNLGGSSFPLLPHAPYMVDPFADVHVDDADERAAEVNRAAHHFSSVTNNPSSTLFDFDEDDMLPFAPHYIGALSDYAIDTNELRRFVAQAGDADSWLENHPHTALPSPLPPRRLSSSSSSLAASPFAATASLPSAFTFSRTRTASSSSSASSSVVLSRSKLHRRTPSFLSPEQEAERRQYEEEQLAQRELAECLSSVPPHFFAADYDLFQQPLFIEHLASISFPASSAAAIRQHTANSLQLQSSLSSQLDLVEVNLFRQINRRSPLLFSALETMQSLHSDISQCVEAIAETREALSYVESNLVSAALTLLDNRRRQRNLNTLCQRLEMMQSCQRTQQTVQLLLSTGDYSSSLLLIQQTRTVLNNELHGVTAMRNVERKLMEQVKMIEKLMEQDVLDILTDTGEAAHSYDEREERARDRRREGGHGGEVLLIRRELTEDEQERLTPVLESLMKLGTMPLVIASYKKELTACIKQRLTDLVYRHIDTVVNDELDDTQVASAANGVSVVVSAASSSPSVASPTSTPAPSPSPTSLLRPASDDGVAQAVSLPTADATASSAHGEGITRASPSPVPDSSHLSSLASAGNTTAGATAWSSSSPTVHTASQPAAAQSAPVAQPSSPMPRSVAKSGRWEEEMSANVAAAQQLLHTQPSSVLAKAAVPDEATVATIRRPAAVAVAASSPSSATTTAAVTASTAAVAPGSSTITNRLQALSHRQFIDFLSPLFSSLMDPIYRAAAVRDLLADIITALDRELDVNAALASDSASARRLLSTVASKKHEYHLHLASMNELLSSSSEFLHLRISKLLSTRSSLHSHLPLREFRELLDAVLSFLSLSEALCHKPFYGLRGALLGQAKGFVAVFHATCMKEMAAVLEKEKWTRVDVEYSYQLIIDNQFVVRWRDRERDREEDERKTGSSKQSGDEEKKEDRNGGAATTRKVLFVPVPKASPSVTPSAASSASSSSLSSSTPSAFTFSSSAASSSSSSNFLKFPVVRSLLTLLTLIADYIDLSTQLPALTLDTLQRLLDLLTLFNSRTCQLVLGAGAMHLAGLTSITATHLALSSQCIALLSTQLPVLKRLFEARLTAKQHVFLSGFDRVRRDCDEHVEQIREKLVGIMRDLVEQLLRKMSQWIVQQCRAMPTAAAAAAGGGRQADEKAEGEDDVVSAAVRLLMKQTCSLHRALSDLLSPRERNLIFKEIGGSLVGGFMVASRKVEAEITALDSAAGAAAAGGGIGGGGGKAKGREDRGRMLLQANGLHVLMRLRTLQGVDEDVVLRLKEYVEQMGVTQKQ